MTDEGGDKPHPYKTPGLLRLRLAMTTAVVGAYGQGGDGSP